MLVYSVLPHPAQYGHITLPSSYRWVIAHHQPPIHPPQLDRRQFPLPPQNSLTLPPLAPLLPPAARQQPTPTTTHTHSRPDQKVQYDVDYTTPPRITYPLLPTPPSRTPLYHLTSQATLLYSLYSTPPHPICTTTSTPQSHTNNKQSRNPEPTSRLSPPSGLRGPPQNIVRLCVLHKTPTSPPAAVRLVLHNTHAASALT